MSGSVGISAFPLNRAVTILWLTAHALHLTGFSRVAPHLLTTSNFIGPWYHAALLFSGLGSIVLLFGVLFSQQIREDLVRAATSPILDLSRSIQTIPERQGIFQEYYL